MFIVLEHRKIRSEGAIGDKFNDATGKYRCGFQHFNHAWKYTLNVVGKCRAFPQKQMFMTCQYSRNMLDTIAKMILRNI